MAWTAPRTWVTGETVTAALMNTHVKDNLNALAPDGATSASWTPVMTQAYVATTAGREWQIGPLQFAFVRWEIVTVGDTGTLAAALPATAVGVTQDSASGQAIGSFHLFDLSTPANSISGTVFLASTTTFRFRQETGVAVTDVAPFALAAGDVLTATICYPVA